MSSRRTQIVHHSRRAVRSALRVWLAAAGVGLGLVTVMKGQERPPAGFVSPPPDKPAADGSNLVSADDPKSEPPTEPVKKRDADFKYPPTYSSKKEKSGFSAFRNWLFGSDDEKKIESPKELLPREVPPGTPPAWKWYGYGAPVPGANVLAPEGVYAPVHPEWYRQMCTTPGAIPLPPPTHFIGLPQLPQPHEIKPDPGPQLPMPAPAPILRPEQMKFPGPSMGSTQSIDPGPDVRTDQTVIPPPDVRTDSNVRSAAEIGLPSAGPTKEPPVAPAPNTAETQTPMAPPLDDTPRTEETPIATSETSKAPAEIQVPAPAPLDVPPPPPSTEAPPTRAADVPPQRAAEAPPSPPTDVPPQRTAEAPPSPPADLPPPQGAEVPPPPPSAEPPAKIDTPRPMQE